MKAGHASRTADFAAAVRAWYAYHPYADILRDPFARYLTSGFYRFFLSAAPLRWLLFDKTLLPRLQASMTLLTRARYAEDRLVEAMARGVDQYIILGAGLDSFSLRRADLAGRLRVYEIDHPDSQRVKLDRMANAGLKPTLATEYLAMDFTRDSLGKVLARSGLDTSKPAFVSWMGVTYYLPQAAIAETLSALAGLLPAGSGLALDYMDARLFDPDFLATRPDIAPSMAKFFMATERLGEPLITGFSPDEIDRLLADCGWQATDNSIGLNVAQQYVSGPANHLWSTEFDHLAHAELKAG
ncbi:MAG: SAM-dependent methyltransferase [Sphingomonadales bacterium]|nr:SAM-dependent methyltransferase [Sphingomonadales bacterium]